MHANKESEKNELVRGEHRLTGREFLVAGEPEVTGYGLYSYILLSAPLNSGNRDRYEAVISAYLSMEKVRRLEEAGAKQKTLNITYLPLRDAPPENPSVIWLLEHYNFARAQVILKTIESVDGDGPYIISYDAQLSGIPIVNSEKLLIQDLSAVPADLVFLWVKEFISQAKKPRYWEARSIHRFMLSLRSNIAVAANAFTAVRSAHADVTSFMESKIKINK